MNLEQFRKEIQLLVLEGKTDDALDALVEMYDNLNGDYYEEVIVLASKYRRWQERNVAGIISDEAASRQLAQINHSILEITGDLADDNAVVNFFNGVTAIEEEATTDTPIKSDYVLVKRNSNWWMIGIGSLVIAGCLLVIFKLVSERQGDIVTTTNINDNSKVYFNETMIIEGTAAAKAASGQKITKVQQQESDNNEDIFHTDLIALGNHIQAGLATKNDKDFFTFTTTPYYRNVVKIRISNQSTQLRPMLQLFNDNRDKIGDKKAANAGASLDYAFQASPNTTYHLGVMNYYSESGNYVLSIGLERFKAEEQVETEPNNDFETANPLQLQDVASGFIVKPANDQDLYAITFPESGKYNIRIETIKNLRSQVTIFDADKNKKGDKSAANAGANLSYPFDAQQGKYFLSLRDYYGSGGDYTLRVEKVEE